jgi:hypothetical protein
MRTHLSETARLEKYRAKLPKPVGRYQGVRAEFEVYRAKDLHRARWNGGALRALTLISRRTYRRYGNRPLLDGGYDVKAAIYLVRARYAKKQFPNSAVEEWLSIRMIPGDGRKQGLGEPELYSLSGKRAARDALALMRKKIGAKDFWKHVASSSRMCGIHPYRVSSKGHATFLEDSHHEWTAVCFALAHKQFLTDYPLDRFPYRYITATIRSDYHKKGLSHVTHGRSVRPAFTSASDFLGVPRGSLHVKRDVYSYQFPLYWFDGKKLLALVNRLRAQAHRPLLTTITPMMFRNIMEGSRRPVLIAGMRIEAPRMRKLMDESLEDYPELKITPAARWYRGMDAVLRAAHVIGVELR